MSQIISVFIIISLTIVTAKFFSAKNPYERIISFYFIFTNFILLILLNSVASFDDILDIIIVLFLLQIVAVLFMLFNRKRI